ncbi:hypothetical protein CH304_00320 [Rhodococcus sp. 15-649-1-2]|nr:hypothetical protein [Rhodococcus sp. 15-649-1-2]OZE88049.1 hypothetical protein CH304_00320 [Rhodococcus sp. 15-649-1-2]
MADNRFADVDGIEQLIGQAIGAASMCWENVEEAGAFESSRAADIAREATERLSQLLGDGDHTEQLIWYQSELARTQAEMTGITSALLNIQDKLRDAENALSEKQAAARQAEEVTTTYGLSTIINPNEVKP